MGIMEPHDDLLSVQKKMFGTKEAAMERKFERFVEVYGNGEMYVCPEGYTEATAIEQLDHGSTLHCATILLSPKITPASVEEDRVRRDERKRVFRKIRGHFEFVGFSNSSISWRILDEVERGNV